MAADEIQSVLWLGRECMVFKVRWDARWDRMVGGCARDAASWALRAPCASTLPHNQLPPRANVNVGVKAADWESNLIWRGRIRILETTTEGSEDEETAGRCEIRLEDAETGELFANAPYAVDGKAIEAVLDSSRYFVLAVVDPASGQRAFLGLVRRGSLVVRLTSHRALPSAATLSTSKSRCKSGHGSFEPS